MPRIDRGVFISGDSPGGVAFCIRLARFQRSSPAKRSDITLVAGSQAWFRHGSSKPASRDGRQKETSKEAKLSERKLRNAQEIKKKAQNSSRRSATANSPWSKPRSSPLCACLFSSLFRTLCSKTLNRSRSFALNSIRSGSVSPPALDETGHSHFAATFTTFPGSGLF